MIDTHSHIDTEAFNEDRADVLDRAWSSGLEAIVIPSIEPSAFGFLQELVQSDERLFRGAGIHPHNVAQCNENDMRIVEEELSKTRVVAVGEIGLDYYYDFAPRDVQQRFFRAQLNIAKNAGLPVIVHNREADEDILRILQEEQNGSLRGVLHCFSSGLEVLHRTMDLGFHVSFTGNVTFKKSTLDEVVRQVPADRFMIETDAPYISPVPHRGKRNEPSFVSFTAEKIAVLRSISLDEVRFMTTTTARKFFGILSVILLCTLSLVHLRAADDEDDDLVNPYKKKVGIGLILTTNTIVEGQTDSGSTKTNSFSYPGVSSYGAMLSYELSDRFMLEGSYIYTNNKTVLRDINVNPFGQQHSNIHQTVELVGRYLWNPYSRVVFYLSAGPTLIMNHYDGGDGVRDDSLTQGRTDVVYGHSTTIIGLAGGLGLFANIKTKYGFIVPGGEWRVDFFLSNEDRLLYRGASSAPIKSNISTMFSLPRFTLQFYPKF